MVHPAGITLNCEVGDEQRLRYRLGARISRYEEHNMKKITLTFLSAGLFLIPLTVFKLVAQAQDAGVLVIEGGTLIDGNGGPPVQNSLILIRGNKIETVS